MGLRAGIGLSNPSVVLGEHRRTYPRQVGSARRSSAPTPAAPHRRQTCSSAFERASTGDSEVRGGGAWTDDEIGLACAQSWLTPLASGPYSEARGWV